MLTGFSWRRSALFALLLLAAPPLLAVALLRVPSGLRIEIGPEDRRYAAGLSREWSFEGEQRYRKLARRARFDLPATVRGPGTLSVWLRGGPGRLRARFDDGTVEERSFDRLESFQPISIELPAGRLRASARLRYESAPGAAAAEVTAVTWESAAPLPRTGLLLSVGVLLVASFAVVLASGASARIAVLATVATAALLLIAAAIDSHAALHWTLRAPAVCLIGLLAVAASRLLAPTLSPSFRVLVYFALLFRAAIVFHPGFYFSDIEMHEVLVERAYHRGFAHLFEHWQEYAGGMGLGASPLTSGRAAFPYPILFHGLTHGANSFLHAPVDWLKLEGALFSALALFPIGVLSRRLGGSLPGADLFAGAIYLFVPCLTQNLLLLKFSAALGHFFDLAVVAFLLRVSLAIEGPKRFLVAAALVAASLASYNSGFIHIGLLVAALLALAPWMGGLARRHAARLATAAACAVPIALVSYQPQWISDFAAARLAEAKAEPAAEGPSPAEGIDAPPLKAIASLGLPVLLLGAAGALCEIRNLEGAPRLLLAAWLLSALAAHALRYFFPVLLLQQKEAYWIAAVLAVLGGLFLARSWRGGGSFARFAVLLALGIALAEWVRWFSALRPYFYSTYLFQ